jgi:hypothetical protein
MDKCLNCDKELVHVEGRRKKKYCDEDCKGQFFRKVKREPKYVQFKTYKELSDKFEAVLKIAHQEGRDNQFENAARGRDEDGSVKSPTNKGDEKINKMIAEMKANEIPRLKGENSIDYRLRCIEINEAKNKTK